MSRTTGVILATGAVTIANETIFTDEGMDWRVPIATGLAAVGFSLAEKAWPQGANILAWTVLLTVMFTRTKSNVPSPVESALKWWNGGGGGGGGTSLGPGGRTRA